MSPPPAPSTALRIQATAPVNAPLAHLNALANASADAFGPSQNDAARRLWEQALLSPAQTFLAEPGKGFRAQLVQMGWNLAGGAPNSCPNALPVVLEWLHAGSLIVDDIQDGSLTRRGRPALHVSHGLPLALNAGNYLYFAAQLHLSQLPLNPLVLARLQSDVIQAVVRCHHGQALDLAAHVESLNQGDVASIVRATTTLKTGALTRLAAVLGARAAGANDEAVEAVGVFGADLGMGLQMLDDLGSLLSAKRREKVLEDLRGGHPTWVWAWLAEEADPFTFARLQNALRQVIAGAPAEQLLHELHDRLSHVGRVRVAAQLDGATQRLSEHLGPSAQLDAVHTELERLRSSYV